MPVRGSVVTTARSPPWHDRNHVTGDRCAMNSGREYTDDSLFDGRLRCLQHRNGYRFSVDAVLLAHFIAPRPGERILDLGAGCGVVSLVLAYRWPGVSLTALEIQPDLAELVRCNIELNGYGQRIELVGGDLRHIERSVGVGAFDWVVSNPPYRSAASGQVSSGNEQALARHEINTDLQAVVRAVVVALRTKGRAALIYPAARGATLIHEMVRQGLAPKRLQTVYSFPGGNGKLLLVEAVKGGGEELAVLPPFYVYEHRHGGYSKEMAGCYLP